MRDGTLKFIMQLFFSKIFVLVKYLLFFVIFIFLFFWFITELPKALKYTNYSEDVVIDSIVVLSGGHGARVEGAANYYHHHKRPSVIMTGHPLLGTTAPKLMKSYSAKFDVHPDDVILEESSYSTKDHPIYIVPIIKKYGFKSILIVTSDYHTRRSFSTFQNYFEDNGIDCDLYVVGVETPIYKAKQSYYWQDHEQLASVLMESFKSLYYLFFVK